jgi:Asp/Glu/hydantoin racemase
LLVEAESVRHRGYLAAAGDPSLVRIREMWTLAVLGVMNSAWPICRFVRPSATRASTSASRCVRPSEDGLPREGKRNPAIRLS